MVVAGVGNVTVPFVVIGGSGSEVDNPPSPVAATTFCGITATFGNPAGIKVDIFISPELSFSW
jgi:hypothetical protein